MKRNFNFIFISAFCVLIFSISSCNSGIDLSKIDDSSITIDESLVLPVGEVNLTVKQFLKLLVAPESVDTANNEVFFTWSFSNEIAMYNFDLSESISPFNKNIVLYQLTNPILAVPANTIMPNVSVKDSFELGLNENVIDEKIDSVFLNSSVIDVSLDVSDDIKSKMNASDFNIEFEFPDNSIIIENGVRPSFNPSGYNVVSHIPIGKYKMYINGKKKLLYQINIKNPVAPNSNVILNSTSYIKLTMKFASADYKVAYGFFHLRDFDRKVVKMPFNIYDYLPNANLKFANPTVLINASTNIGANFDIKTDFVTAYNTSDPNKKIWAFFDTNKSVISKSEKLNGPVLFGEWGNTVFPIFDSNNGGTDQLFDNPPFPNMLDYQYSIAGDPARTKNFVSPDGKIRINGMIKVPLKLKGGSSYSFSDTIKNFNVGSMLDGVDSAILVVKVTNGLPLKANYRMTFCKSNLLNDTLVATGVVAPVLVNEYITGNLFSKYKIESPTVTSDGTVIGDQIKSQTILITLSKSQMEALKLAKFIVFHASLDAEKSIVNGIETPNPIHITTANSFGVKLGILLKSKFTTTIGSSN